MAGAKAIVAKFRNAGFRRDRSAKYLFKNVEGISGGGRNLKNWKGLERAMRERPGDLDTIGVAALIDSDAKLYLTIHHWGRKTGGTKTIFDDGTRRQYGLEIHFSSDKVLFGSLPK